MPPVNGSVWIEGSDIHYLDSTGTERSFTFTDTTDDPAATVGSIWVEGNYLHYIDSSGNERREQGDLVGTPGGAVVGSAWIEGQCLHYIDSSGEERKHCPVSVTVDCADLCVCPVSEAGGACDTSSGCDTSGEAHLVEWDHTNCDDASHHVALHRSTNGGSFIEVQDLLSCTNTPADTRCCDRNLSCGYSCTPEGSELFYLGKSTDGGQTTDYEYRVRIENDGTDTAVDSLDTGECTDCGGDGNCIQS